MKQKPLPKTFVSTIKAMVGKYVTVKMKNGLSYTGTLASVADNLDLELNDVTSIAPHTISVMSRYCIKGSSVKCVALQTSDVDNKQVYFSPSWNAAQAEEMARDHRALVHFQGRTRARIKAQAQAQAQAQTQTRVQPPAWAVARAFLRARAWALDRASV